jgi:integrase
MARSFGKVFCDRKHGRAYWGIDVTIEGERYKLRGYRTQKKGRLIRFPDEHSARDALEEARADIRKGIDPLQALSELLPPAAVQGRFEDRYTAFCEARESDRINPISEQRIKHLWGHLKRGHLDELRDVPAQLITYADLEDWAGSLFQTTKLSSNSIRHIACDVRTFLNWLERRREIAVAPKVPSVTVGEYVPTIPTPAVQERVLGAIDWRLRGLFLSRGFLGLRPSEARNANLADYRFDPDGKDVLTIPKSKSNRFRLLPVPAPLSAWVREHRPIGNLRDADSKPEPLFDNPKTRGDGRWHQSSERRVLLAAMTTCGVKYRPNEFLRHAFGTNTANRLLAEGNGEGDSIRILMAIMGHTESKTSARYIRLATEGMEYVVARSRPGHVPEAK